MKIVLKVKLIGQNKLEMTLCKVGKDSITEGLRHANKIHVNKDNNIVIWSCQDFIFDSRQIRLPDVNNIEKKLTHTYRFESDVVRKIIMKKYVDALLSWSNDQNIFTKSHKSKIKYEGEFIIIE